jgi:hypothetical protein
LKNKTTGQATITKFGTNLKPIWTVRNKATSSAVVANGASSTTYAAYENGGSSSLITFDKNGKVTATKSFLGQPVAIGFNKTFGLYIYTGSTIYNLITK